MAHLPAYREPSLQFGQWLRRLWDAVTSKPLTSREVEFARKLIAETQEACAAEAERHFHRVCAENGKTPAAFQGWNAAASIRALPSECVTDALCGCA